jgi:peptide/nickel transport system permease protein
VLLVGVLTYLATQVLPGDAATAILGQDATPARLRQLRQQLGLNRPLIPGLLHWFGNLLTGHLGKSLVEGIPVGSVVFPRLENSVVLVLIAAVVSTVVGTVAGVIAARYKDRWVDDLSSTVALVASGLPEFVVGIFVVFVLAVGVFHWFPGVSLIPPGSHPWSNPSILVLPSLTLVIVTAPYVFRMVRATMIEALQSDFAELAELKGVPRMRLLLRHALPSAMAPSVQVVGLNLLYLAGGIVLVETVFQYPGIGLELVSAIQSRDVPVIQFLVVFLAAIYVVLNILTDVVVLLVSPRRRAPR